METTRKKLVPYSPPPVPARSLEDNDSGDESVIGRDASGDEGVVTKVSANDCSLPLAIDPNAMSVPLSL